MKARKAYIINQLRAIGTHRGAGNTTLESMEYRELLYLLAAKKAVAQ